MLILAAIAIGFAAIGGLAALNLWYYRSRAAKTEAERAAEDEAARTETRIW